jgi:broad specificity phosphatase PhoE
MLMPSRRTIVSLVLASGLSAMLPIVAPVSAMADDKTLAQALRAGGLVIVFRHGGTFPDQADTDPLNLDNVKAQRQLNDSGKAAAKMLGEAFRQIGVPIGKVYTSRFHRAYETAVLAGLTPIEKTTDISEGGLVVTPNENTRRARAFRQIVGTAPPAGTNVVLVTHKPNIVDALGKDWVDVKEGEASIFRPEGGSYKLVARVQMDEWTRIAAAK